MGTHGATYGDVGCPADHRVGGAVVEADYIVGGWVLDLVGNVKWPNTW